MKNTDIKYKTSDNYELLYDLLKDGIIVIGFTAIVVNDKPNMENSKLVEIKYSDEGSFFEIGSIVISSETFDKNDFCEICKENNVRFIDVFKETPEQFFKSVMDRITEIKISDDYPNLKTYSIDGKNYLHHNIKMNEFYLNYNNFWILFESKFNLNYLEIQELTKSLLEDYLNCVVTTTRNFRTNY